MERFHRVARVPVHSNQAIHDRADAIAATTGSLDLAVCGSCGFIANTAFESSLQDYTEGYEEEQAHSPRFRAFRDQLIADLVGRHRLRGGCVLEIGCGKGDFLLELCRVAGARGVGIDPAATGGTPEGAGVTFLREPYGAHHASIPFDLACCRHTLEHVGEPAGLVSQVRAAIGSRDATFFVEVPDTGRILRERAFWDVYFEHCSYFGAGSLGRLMRRCGFALASSEIAYEGQYLLMEARPGSGGLEPPDDTAETVRACRAFGREVGATLAAWRSRILGLRAEGRTIVMWGAGSKAVGFLTGIDADDAIGYVVDINPAKHGTYLPVSGQEVISPQRLPALAPDLVIAMNPVYREEIAMALRGMGLGCALETL